MKKHGSGIRRLAAWLLFSFLSSSAAFAQFEKGVRSPVESRPRDVRQLERSAPVVDFVIEFRQAQAAMTTDAMRTRAAALPSVVDALRRDLARLDADVPQARRTIATGSSVEPARVTHTYSRVLFGAGVRGRRELLPAIQALPYVASVRVARTFKAMLANSVAQIRAKDVWTVRGTRGKGVVVAVIDTGVDYTHPALGGGFGAGHKVIGGYDFINDDADPKDDHGHGTHVAGIIAASGGDALTGVAPEASILAYKVLSAEGYGSEVTVIAAVERSVDPDQNNDTSDHADIVNMSLGASALDDDPVVRAVENATAAGVTFCISSGNAGSYGDLPSPALAPSAITVGAVDVGDFIAGFSNRGPTLNFTVKPEIVAPGVSIVSTFLNGKTESLSGTSMAAPHAAGVAALIKSLHRDWSAAEIKAALVGTAKPLETDLMDQGGGRIDALHATAPAVFATPVSIDFGQVGGGDLFVTTKQVTLRNVTTQTQTLTASVSGQREGIAVQVTPNVVTLAPGASQLVTLQLSFSNKLVPAPQSGSLSFGGFVTWSGGSSPFHMPWTTVKAAFLTIDVTNNITGVWATIVGHRKKHVTNDFGQRVRVLWRLEPVDIVIFEDRRMAGDYPVHVMFAENVDIAATGANVTIDMNEAKHTFDTANTIGPHGTPLVALNDTCIDEAIMVFPGGKKFGFGQTSVVNGDPVIGLNYHTRWGRLSSRVQVYITTACHDAAANAFYVAAHDRLDGLEGHVQTTMSQRWSSQKMRFASESNDSRGLTTAVARLVFRKNSDEEEFYGGAAMGHLLRPVGPELTMHFTSTPANPGMRILSGFERFLPCDSGPECITVDNVVIYPDAEGSLVDSELYIDISPMAYRAQPGRTLMLGEAPVSPTAGLGGGIGLWVAGVVWKGAFGERRPQEMMRSHVTVRNDSGAVIGEATGVIVKEETLPPGRYRIHGTSPEIVVGGKPARATVDVAVDTSQEDPYVPKFTAVRIEDENHQQTTIVRPRSNATLLFSLADDYNDPPYTRRRMPREEATRVEYRVHGTSEWRSLPALVTSRHYQRNSFLYEGVGTMYRVDLSSITGSHVGPIDLRFHGEDATGNSTGFTLAPAFVISNDGARRRSVRH